MRPIIFRVRFIVTSLCVITALLMGGFLYLSYHDFYFNYDEVQRYVQSSYRDREPLLPYMTFNVSEIYNSGFLIENVDLCRRKVPKLLILVISAPQNFKARTGIRATWARFPEKVQHQDAAVSFFVGSTSNAISMQALLDESVAYGDMIVGNNYDSYQNLTLKSISLLEWTLQHCDQASFVLKIDDDVFLNLNRLMEVLDGNQDVRWTMFGHLVVDWEPVRDINDKYYLPPGQYAGNVLPSLLTGPAYVLSSDVIRPLYVAALTSRFLVLEDVFLTGILADQLEINKVNVTGFHVFHMNMSDCRAIAEAITIHHVEYVEQFYYWRKIQDATPCLN